MKIFISALIASFFLYLSFASAESSNDFASMEGRTQLDVTGSASYSTYSGFNWFASGSGFYYVTPHFGIGGSVGVERWNASNNGLLYNIGPAAEYFVPVGERGHIFTQILTGISGAERSGSTFLLTGLAGYRYFVSDDIALSVKLSQTWSRENSPGTPTTTGDPRLLFGFSLFF